MEPRGSGPPAALAGVFVLLVGEDAVRRAILGESLRYCGAFVREADSVAEARRVMDAIVPTLQVVCLCLPAEVAWVLVHALRAVRPDDGSKIPIVGVGPSALAAAARVNGLDGYIEEPIDAWDLCQMVATLTS